MTEDRERKYVVLHNAVEDLFNKVGEFNGFLAFLEEASSKEVAPEPKTERPIPPFLEVYNVAPEKIRIVTDDLDQILQRLKEMLV